MIKEGTETTQQGVEESTDGEGDPQDDVELVRLLHISLRPSGEGSRAYLGGRTNEDDAEGIAEDTEDDGDIHGVLVPEEAVVPVESVGDATVTRNSNAFAGKIHNDKDGADANDDVSEEGNEAQGARNRAQKDAGYSRLRNKHRGMAIAK